jgi:ABC-type bacteriocin/lantibiotic exporter with double-glycine peptidase domain
MVIDNTIRSLLNILIYLGLIAAITPWFLVALPPAAVAFLLLYAVFRVGIRRLQRRQLASMSPLLAHVDATVRGLSSIHAYGQTNVFAQRYV